MTGVAVGAGPVGARDPLSLVFAALADPTRRAMLTRLRRGPATVAEIGEPFDMTGPAVSKHLRVLERAGLVSRGRVAQSRPATLQAEPMQRAAEWTEQFRDFWEHRYDRLEDYLRTMPDEGRMNIWPNTFTVSFPDETSILVRRDFDAGPDKVWRAMTEPEHLRRWLGDPSFPLTTCDMDVRVGGSYRWVFSRPDGTMGVRGTYDEVERPHRLVSTEQFDDFPGPSVNTLVLAERVDGRTAMTLTVRYLDRVTRDGWAASGMTEGLGAGYERLDVVLTD